MDEARHGDQQPVDLAVIIPSYKSGDNLPRCLDGLAAQCPPPREVIVVDSSPDFPRESYRRRHPRVRFIHLPERVFAGKARNIGAEAASATFLVFLDTDCVVPPGWTRAVMAAFHRHPGRRAFAGSLRNANPAHIVGWVSFLSEFSGYIGRCRQRRVACLPAYCLAIRRDTFLASGGFPEDFWPGEDAVFSRRLFQQGHTLLIEPSVTVAHINRTRYRDYLRHQFRLGRSFALSRERMPSMAGGNYYLRSGAYLPCMALYRGLLTAGRLLRDYPGGLALLLLLSPLYIGGCLGWLAGAAAGRKAAIGPARHECWGLGVAVMRIEVSHSFGRRRRSGGGRMGDDDHRWGSSRPAAKPGTGI